jgi:phosphoenolpyruvate carboxykinase (GTP)
MRNEALVAWVNEVAGYTKPEAVRWCNGSSLEARSIEDRMVEDGTLVRLSGETHPRCFLHRSNPSDVARTEHLTFICSNHPEDAGPTERPGGKDSQLCARARR